MRRKFDPWVELLLEKEVATHSSILAWKIPWTEEPGRLYSPWDRQRVGPNLVTKHVYPASFSDPTVSFHLPIF